MTLYAGASKEFLASHPEVAQIKHVHLNGAFVVSILG
jgi:hypothetical protein